MKETSKRAVVVDVAATAERRRTVRRDVPHQDLCSAIAELAREIEARDNYAFHDRFRRGVPTGGLARRSAMAAKIRLLAEEVARMAIVDAYPELTK